MRYFLLQSRMLDCSSLEDSDEHIVVYGPPKVQNPIWIPVGNVWYCETQMDSCGVYVPRPDNYPEFLHHMMHREFEIIELAPKKARWKNHGRFFVKPANKYKQFAGYVAYSPTVYLSEVVNFVQEWRYYVADGKVLYTGWYKGEDDEERAPTLDVEWPEGYCGAVDFGRLDTGQIALVEAHHPYACGNYGEISLYAQWLEAGWRYIVKLSAEADEFNQTRFSRYWKLL